MDFKVKELQITGNLDLRGTITGPGLARAVLLLEEKLFPVPLVDARVWDAIQTNLPGTSATDDLGLYGTSYGTAAPLIRTSDLMGAGATTRYARWPTVRIPAEYIAAGSFKIRCNCGMVTTVASVSAMIDVEAWRVDDDGTLGAADLVSTSATSFNSLTYADKDFNVTATTLSPGDILDVRVTMAINDGAAVGAVIGALAQLKLVCNIRG